MSKPTTRILAVLELLQAHGQLSGNELAQRLDIDRRTLRRYIVALEDIGIPIMTERGRYGGYSLIPGFKLPPMVFNEEEAMALSMGLLAAKQVDLVDYVPAIDSAQAKLKRVMPKALGRKVEMVAQTVSLDLPASQNTMGNTNDWLYVLAEAISEHKQVFLEYTALNGDGSDRSVNPYGLAYYLGHWYLVGFCLLRNGLRIFRLDRITSLAILATGFTHHDEFDAIAHLRNSIADIPRQFSVEILLKSDLKTAQTYIQRDIGLLVQVGEGVHLYNQSDDLEWLARQVASWPFEFEIIKPNALKEEIRIVARRLLTCCSG